MSRAAEIREGLIARGLPPHVAEGFVMNFADESGLDPGINEIAPLVPGSRGGYGLAQWTGPRRNALESYSGEVGRPASDVDLQLDFLVSELQGPESRAFDDIMRTNSPGEAAAAIASSFLRPAKSHLDRRVSNYLGGGGGDYEGYDYGGTGNALSPQMPEQPQMAENALQPWAPPTPTMLDPAMFMTGRRNFG
jgi:hypothetical protein